jgi:hypothetical protein
MSAARSWRIRIGLEHFATWLGKLAAVALIALPLVWMLLPADHHRRKASHPRHARPAAQSQAPAPGEVALAGVRHADQ